MFLSKLTTGKKRKSMYVQPFIYVGGKLGARSRAIEYKKAKTKTTIIMKKKNRRR